MKTLKILLLPVLIAINFVSPLHSEGARQNVPGQRVRITGVVMDSLSREILPFANILNIESPSENIVSDENGRFSVSAPKGTVSWRVSYAGYGSRNLKACSDTVVEILLTPSSVELSEVTVKPKKGKYSKKNNPAVELMLNIRKHAAGNDPSKEPFYSYDKYEKTLIALNDFSNDFSRGFSARKGAFLKNYVDTSSWTGSRLLDIMIKEKASTKLFSQSPKAEKEVVRGYRSAGMDEVLNQKNMQVILEDAIRDMDIYGNDITVLQNRFVSPLSAIGADFYKYVIQDTVFIGSDKCIELGFAPHNPQSMGFNGRMYVVAGDSAFFVKKITMRTPSAVNLNFVDALYVNQTFEKDSLGKRHKTYDDVCIEFQITDNTPGLYGRKTTVYDNFSFKKHPEMDGFYTKLGRWFELDGAYDRDDGFWNANRMIPLTAAESRMGGMTKEMRKVPLFYWGEKVISLLESGYVRTGRSSKIDLGPVNTLLSGNTVEGLRIRVGGMTMAPLNPHLFAKGYVAYGTRDRKWKYEGALEYSFARKPNHSYEWPRHGFYGSYSYDLDMLGQHYLFTNSDNVFLSLKRKESVLVTYRRLAKAGYILELPNNVSVEASLRAETQQATRWVPFIFADGRQLSSFRQSAFSLSLRWAPGEKFIQGRTQRAPVNMDAWIIQFTQEYAPRGFLGSAFTQNKSELSVQKRIWFSAFGYANIILKAGKLWDAVYYPALLWPNANLSYTIQPESFALMNPMEFANDKYASLDIDYYGNGILFNHFPLLKRLKLRETVTFRALTGGLDNRNNPAINKSLLKFPQYASAEKMGKTPYMELGVGIDNIFKILRVDYVWRLTYLGRPDIDKSGLRVALHFSF